ncbi:cellulose binding domain-containing protein [Pedobacter sp. R-06]|uniref:cellulose binding domain-containing protein n=1 Tax=Pedobacter sp. R-06 TaxID=3404051 RepID=UPI003CEB87DD
MMNKYFFILLSFILSVCLSARSQTFVHPGIPLSGSDLSILKAHVQAGDYPWKQAYDLLAADGKSQLTYMPTPYVSISRNPNVNLQPWRNDMVAAFFHAMMWNFTGNEAHAKKSRDILMAWATTQTEFGGIESNLDLGDYAYAYGGAASILRGSWSGWTAENTTAVKNLFNNVYWPSTGCAGYALGPANKGTLSIAGGAAIAAFSDDPAKMAHIVHLMRYIGSTGFKNTLPSGEHGESGRDQGHSHGMWSGMAFTAEVFWKQGIDLYSELDNRLLYLGEYFAKTNTGKPIGFVPFGTTDWYYLTAAPYGWDGGRWGLTLLHGAYNVRKGLGTPYVSKRLNTIPGRFDLVNTWFYKSEDNSTAAVPPQTEIVPPAGKVGTGGLTSLDIGTASPSGSSSYNNNVWTVSGSGAEILTHSADAFHFVYKEVTGNCSIIAKVETAGGGALNARAGVMLRSDLTSTSAQRIWIAIKSGKRAESFMHGWTEVRGGSNWEKQERPIPQDAYWVKIERIGDVINTYYSPDGTSWATEAQGRFEGFTGKAYVGLMVCSNANGVLNTAVFNNVSVTEGQGGMVTLPEAPHSIYAYGGNNQVQLSWLSSFGADSYTVKRSSSENGLYTTIASGLTGNSFLDAGVANGQTYYYKVCAVNMVGTSPDSPADSDMPEAPYVPQTVGLQGGIYRIIATHSNKAVGVKNSSIAEGALIGQRTYQSTSNQHWTISQLSGTDYKIINLLSGKALDVVNNATANGAIIEQRTYSDTDPAQIWFIKDRENGTFNIIGKQSQKALEVPGSSTSDGATMNINRWLDGTNQIFRLELVSAQELNDAYLQKLAEAKWLRDSTAVSTTNIPGRFPVTANTQLSDSITYVQQQYNQQSTPIEISGFNTVLQNAIERYKASMYYQTNMLADGNYFLKPLNNDSLWTRNATNTPLFDVANPDPLLQIWNVKKQGNGRYKIICLSAPSGFSNYINENAQFGRTVSPYQDVWNSMNIYFNGTSYAVQRAQTAGNGYWFINGNQVQSVPGSDNDPVPYNFPFAFVPAGTIPLSLTVAAGDAKNILEWSPVANSTYNIKRAATPGGPYTTIASQTNTGFTDTGVSNGTPYYYIVAAADSSVVSTEVAALPNVGQLVNLKFDEAAGTRAIDSWGANHGTLAATASRASGKEGTSLKLDGTATSYATLPTGIVKTLSDFTISSWVKMDALSTWMRVFDFGTGTAQYMFLTVQQGTPTVNGVKLSTVRYAIKKSGTELNVSANYAFPLDTWTHLAVTQSGNTAKLFINGALVSTNAALTIKPMQLTVSGTATGTTLNYLGKSQFNDPLFKGAIDEFKIYSRALSDAEIAQSAKSEQTINFNVLPDKTVTDTGFNAGAVSSSGLAISYASSDTTVATVLNNMVQIKGAGITTITATQEGNEKYTAAVPVGQTLTVNKVAQTINFASLTAKRIGDADVTLSATSNANLPLNYSSSDTTVAKIVNDKLQVAGNGTTVITAQQGGNGTYAAASVTQAFSVVPFNIQVQSMDGDNGQLSNNVIRPNFSLVNQDSTGINYNELTMRYWFTAENYAGINTWVDYAQMGNSNVKMKYVQLPDPASGALGYMEYSFISGGKLNGNSNSGVIRTRFANQDWSDLSEADDYSYQANTGSYGVNNHITLYRNGKLISGAEPAPVQATTKLNVFYQNQNLTANSNTISAYIAIKNVGNSAIDYGDLTARYWFSKEGTAGLNMTVDYAKLGNNKIKGNFTEVSPSLAGADTHLELSVDQSAGKLFPLSSTGNIQFRINKTNWSAFNESNDHSYLPKAAMDSNAHITLYYKGQLIYGIEPAASGFGQPGNLSGTQPRTGIIQAEPLAQELSASNIIYPNPVKDQSFKVRLTPDLRDQNIKVTIRDVVGSVIQSGSYRAADRELQVGLSGNYRLGVYFVYLNKLAPIRLIVDK